MQLRRQLFGPRASPFSKAIPDTGSIVLRAGAGHLPTVLQCASALNSEREDNWRNGDAIVSALAAPATWASTI